MQRDPKGNTQDKLWSHLENRKPSKRNNLRARVRLAAGGNHGLHNAGSSQIFFMPARRNKRSVVFRVTCSCEARHQTHFQRCGFSFTDEVRNLPHAKLPSQEIILNPQTTNTLVGTAFSHFHRIFTFSLNLRFRFPVIKPPRFLGVVLICCLEV